MPRSVSIIAPEDEQEIADKQLSDMRRQFGEYQKLCTRHPDCRTVDWIIDGTIQRHHVSRSAAFVAYLDKQHILIAVQKLWMN